MYISGDDPIVRYVKLIINVILHFMLSVSIHMLSSSIGLVFGKRIFILLLSMFMDRVESILS